ncbi:hypothetical protein Trco_008504 [Trichoderma cornu-damae]|uniref:SSCRP protein n=1 Tax=Trichoderma cornu-damae TaxID=654480 RepID=A0A9P8TU43_9HYPO|nr:hypothetical protein Trco_008504 [Trichoderma cornu-damae]
MLGRVMRHPRRQQLGLLAPRSSWPSTVFVLLLLLFGILASPASALPATPTASPAAALTQTLLAASRNRHHQAALAPSQPPQLRIPHLIWRGDSDNDSAAAASPPSPPPPYKPFVTPPPDRDADLAKMGYSMITFYTCDTISGQEQCGWHVPALKADGPTTRTDVRVVLAVVSCLAGILAWGLV